MRVVIGIFYVLKCICVWNVVSESSPSLCFTASLLWSPIGPEASCLHPWSQIYSRSGCCWTRLAQPYILLSRLTSLVCGALQGKGIMGHIDFLHATMKCGWLLFFIDKHKVWCDQSYPKLQENIYICLLLCPWIQESPLWSGPPVAPITQNGLTLIRAWISNYLSSKV